MIKIFCDIDSTINDHWRRIRRNTVPNWPNGRLDKKAFTEAEIMEDYPIDYNCVLDNIVLAGAELSFLTARNFIGAREITVKWLKEIAKIAYKELYIVPSMESKIDFLAIHRPDYYIDDFMSGQENSIPTFRRGIAEAIENLGINVIVFRNDWNDVLEQIQYYEKAKTQ